MDLIRHLRYSLLVAISVWVLWLALLGFNDASNYIIDNWEISLTMAFSSFVAGATSEGGGAVAFPIFTKILHVEPWNAKLFAIAIQSVGMTAASLLILLMRVQVEWRAICWSSVGGAVGMVLGAIWLAPLFPPDVTKIIFTVMVSSFAVALIISNYKNQKRHNSIPINGPREVNLLLLVGFIGGVLTSVVGTGIDILTFSVMVLLFRISEKVATPTSVILMAINSLVGLLMYSIVLEQMNQEVFGYWMAAIPVVVVGAPLGAIVCVYMSRKLIVNSLIVLIFIELVSSLLIIELRDTVIMFSTMGLIGCFTLYYIITAVPLTETKKA